MAKKKSPPWNVGSKVRGKVSNEGPVPRLGGMGYTLGCQSVVQFCLVCFFLIKQMIIELLLSETLCYEGIMRTGMNRKLKEENGSP